MLKAEPEVLSNDTSAKKQKKDEVNHIREGISKLETALTLAVAEGNKRAQLAIELSLKGLKSKLEKIKKL